MSWIPKVGEMINVGHGDTREFIGIASSGNYLCWSQNKERGVVWEAHKCSEIKPEPIIERRWKWLKDNDGYTTTTTSYYPINRKFDTTGWYRSEDYIDVEIKELK